jgi:hypothetical protein
VTLQRIVKSRCMKSKAKINAAEVAPEIDWTPMGLFQDEKDFMKNYLKEKYNKSIKVGIKYNCV